MKGSDFTILETGKMDIPRFDLTDKVAIITGVASDIGIGRGIARTYAAYGAKLVIADMDAGGIELRAREIAAEFDAEVIPVRCDIRSEEDRKTLVDTCMEAFGRIDILVNNAGVVLSNDQLAQDVTEEEWDRVVDTDYKAVFFLTQRVAEIMIKQAAWQYHQHRFGGGARCFDAHVALCIRESGGGADDTLHGVRVGTFQHPCELHLPGVYRDEHDANNAQ